MSQIETLEEFEEKFESDRHGNQKLSYRIFQTLKNRKKHIAKHRRNKSGKIIHVEKEIRKRFKEYFEETLNTDPI